MHSVIAIVAAALAALVSIAIGVVDRRSPARFLFGIGMALFAIEGLLAVESTESVALAGALSWQRLRLAVLALVPSVWLSFSLVYSRGNYRDFLRGSWWLVFGLVAVPVALAWGANGSLIAEASRMPETLRPVFQLSGLGTALYACLVVGYAAVIVNLERTFRASVGTMRWRLKLVVLGLFLLFGVRVYTASQSLVGRHIDTTLSWLGSASLLGCCLLIGFSLRRTRLFSVNVYPSQALLRQSLTLAVIGSYLVVVGLLARWASWLGGARGLQLGALLVLVALVALGLALMSDRLRLRAARFVSRHFGRPQYDYRQVWHGFSQRLSGELDEVRLCRAATIWISETLSALSVTVWLVDEAAGRLRAGSSTLLSDTEAGILAASSEDLENLLRRLKQNPEPVDLESSNLGAYALLQQICPGHFPEGGRRVVAPLLARGELVGLLAVGDRVGGAPLTGEELDLIRCVADQAATSLLSIRLSQRLVQASEMEAFQTMSTFLVHDLKNTANTLSLMLENLPRHFDNPEFRGDALKSIGRTVERVNELISHFGQLRRSFRPNLAEADLNAIVRAALERMDPARCLAIEYAAGECLPTQLDAALIESVVVNLVSNASEALTEGGRIRVSTRTQGRTLVLAVADDGCGMSAEFVRTRLFRPFQTTKKRGIGIGMYQCKVIVEAHGGKISVQSSSGRGTVVQAHFPVTPAKPVGGAPAPGDPAPRSNGSTGPVSSKDAALV